MLEKENFLNSQPSDPSISQASFRVERVILDRAKELKVNISAVCRNALRNAIDQQSRAA